MNHYRLRTIVAAAFVVCSTFVSTAYERAVDLFVITAGTVTDLIMTPFRMAKVSADLTTRRLSFSLIAFKVIGLLKPDYDDSLDTHGLSLRPG